MKKLLVAALMVVLASPAFAAIQNVKVSGDITSTYLYRDNFDLGTTLGNDVFTVDGTKYYVGGGDTLNTSPFSDGWDPLGLKKQSLFITQTRVRIDADLSDNVSTTVGLINERAWNSENAYDSPSYNGGYTNYANDTDVQLYLASVTLREFLYSPLTITVGRQVFNYGNGLIMGDGGPNNMSTGNLEFIAGDLTERTAYDGIKATLDYKPLTIDLFYFKNGQTILSGNPNSGSSSSDVYGFNANYQLSDPWSTVFETYMFSRINGNHYFGESPELGGGCGDESDVCDESPFDKGDTLFVPGLRASTNPVKGLNVQGELAWQFGNVPTFSAYNGSAYPEIAEKREAMAAQFLASYALPVLDKYKPTVNAAFTYVSGDKNSAENYNTDAVKSAKYYTAWDEFNKNQGAGTIYNTLFPLSNMYIYSLGGSINPLEDVTASVTWSDLLAAEKYSLQNPLYVLQPDLSGAYNGYLLLPSTNHKELGNETDINLTYNYTEDVTFGVSVGWFVPGDAFTDATRNTASQAIANVAVKF